MVSLGESVLLAAVALAACFKTDAPPPIPPRNDAAPIEIKRQGSDYGATVADPVGFLPIDSELVLSLDVEQLRRSGLWRLIEPRIMSASGSTFANLRVTCGIDPVHLMRGFTLGFTNLGEDKPDGVLVLSGLDRMKLTKCMQRTRADGSQITNDNGIITFAPMVGEPPTIAFAFVDESTVVALMGTAVSAEALVAVLRAGSPLRTSPAFVELFGMIDVERGLWGVMNGNSKLFDKTAMIGVKPKAVFGSVGLLTDGLASSVHIRFGDITQPAQLASMAQGQIGGVKTMFDRLDVTAADNDLVIDLEMSEQQVENLMNLFGPLGP